MTDPQFMLHNHHLEDPANFSQRDPQLKTLLNKPYIFIHPLIAELPKDIPGIYTISGGRQIGKTTLSKQWMKHLLDNGIAPQCIAYFTGEIIVDHLSLIRQLQTYIEAMPTNSLNYLIVDEVTYIQNWDMGVKFLADAGLIENVVLVLTGSDLIIIQEARMRFPGRRGKANKVDFHIYPLSFFEVLKLTDAIKNIEENLHSEKTDSVVTQEIANEFEKYLQHGGYLTAINDYAEYGEISKPILDTYADWIRGDTIKHGKSDHHCRTFFTAMLKRLNSQVTWNSLAKDFAIEHHKTIADYAELLMSMDAIFIQQALVEDKLVGATKKARKLVFSDPFIYHSINSWLNSSNEPYREKIYPAVQDPIVSSYLVELCVTNQFRRFYPTFYIKSEGEVDVVYVKNKRFWPVEVKWRQQVRSKDLKQIQKYPNGIILGKQNNIQKVNSNYSYPLPWYLAKLGYEHSVDKK